jgi:hypothetical protein
VCAAFPSLQSGDHRVVGFELPTGIVLVPSLVLKNIPGYASRGLRVVLDSGPLLLRPLRWASTWSLHLHSFVFLAEFDDRDDGTGAYEVNDDADSESPAPAPAPAPAKPSKPSQSQVTRGEDDGFPLKFDLFPGDAIGLNLTRDAVSDLFALVIGTNLCGCSFRDVAARFLEVKRPPVCLCIPATFAETTPAVSCVCVCVCVCVRVCRPCLSRKLAATAS